MGSTKNEELQRLLQGLGSLHQWVLDRWHLLDRDLEAKWLVLTKEITASDITITWTDQLCERRAQNVGDGY